MPDDRYALAALAARDLASSLAAATARLPVTSAQGFAVGRTVYAVSAVMAPLIQTAADVAAIGVALAGAAAILQGIADPQDAAPVFYDAATASAAAAPVFASPARTIEGALARMLAECLEAAWLGNAFVCEAQTTFGDRQDAIAARARIAAAMDASLDRIAAATGRAVVDLLGSVANTATGHIAQVAANLRPLVRVQTARSAPSTAVAFALYGDPSQAPDLVARNRVATPLFMPTTLDALAPTRRAPTGRRADMLYGIAAIAAHVGMTKRQALYRFEKGQLPAAKMGRAIVASRATLDAWSAGLGGAPSEVSSSPSTQLDRIEAMLADLAERVANLEEARDGERS